MRLTKSLLLAAVVLGLISFLAALKPPVAQYPVVEFRQQEIAIRVLLKPLTGTAACHNAAHRIGHALTAACPTCKLTQSQCLIQLSQVDSQVLSQQARPHPTLLLKGGVMQFKSGDVQQARQLCEETAATGIGRCLAASGVSFQRPDIPTSNTANVARAFNTLDPLKATNPSRSTNANQARTQPQLQPTHSVPPAPWQQNLVFTVVALALCLAVVATSPLHGKYSMDMPASGIQKLHTQPVPRVGGVALYFSFVLAYLVLVSLDWAEPDLTQSLLKPMLFAALPAFVFGFAEDLTRVVGVTERLLATMASAVLAWWLTGVSLTQLDTPGLDTLLAVLPLSVAFTAFAVGGVANAVNMIDGAHGLASGFFILACAAIGIIALQVADPALAQLALLTVAVALGFFFVNYPFGRLFLGDGGAYLLGFWLAWLCVLLPMRNPEVSAWAPLLICIHPVAEALYSIWRRLAARLYMANPDRAHLHSLIQQTLQRSSNSNASASQAGTARSNNARVAPWLWLFSLLPISLATHAFQHSALMVLGCVLCGLGYVGLYQFFSARARMRLQCGTR